MIILIYRQQAVRIFKINSPMFTALCKALMEGNADDLISLFVIFLL